MHVYSDIVDHRHSTRDGVWHMLVGSISRETDRDNSPMQTNAVEPGIGYIAPGGTFPSRLSYTGQQVAGYG